MLEDPEEVDLEAFAWNQDTYVSVPSLTYYLSRWQDHTDSEETKFVLMQIMKDMHVLHEDTIVFYPDLSEMLDHQKVKDWKASEEEAKKK